MNHLCPSVKWWAEGSGEVRYCGVRYGTVRFGEVGSGKARNGL